MSLYAVLGNFTNKRRENIKGIPKGLAASKKALAAVGATMVTLIFTMGQYDVVAIIDAPSDTASSPRCWILGNSVYYARSLCADSLRKNT